MCRQPGLRLCRHDDRHHRQEQHRARRCHAVPGSRTRRGARAGVRRLRHPQPRAGRKVARTRGWCDRRLGIGGSAGTRRGSRGVARQAPGLRSQVRTRPGGVIMNRLMAALLMLLSAIGSVRAADVAIPAGLEAWRGWALQGAEFRRCPFLAARNAAAEQSYRCAWPGALTLAVDARGGSFTQHWQTYADTWITLPGSADYWPTEVRANGAALAVVLRAGVP